MAKVITGVVGGFEWVDGMINTVSGSLEENITHAFIILPDEEGRLKTYEAEGTNEDNDKYAGFWAHDAFKWVNNKCVRFIVVDVPDELYAKGVNYCHELVGTRYGYFDCVRGGVFTLFGEQLPDNAFFVDCSEATTRIFRKMEQKIVDGVTAGAVIPFKYYNSLINDLNGVVTSSAEIEAMLMER